MSRNCASIIERSTPRRRWVGLTPTAVTPPQGREPPGTDSSNGKAPAPPTISPSSKAACIRSCGRTLTQRSKNSSLGGGLKYWPIAPIARAYSSRSVQARTSNMDAKLQLLERGVVEHQLPLAAVVGEANRDEAARFDSHHDSLAERRVAD